MNNNEISNPKVEVPKGMQLNDKDYLGDLLSCLKAIVKDYTVAMTEASNEELYHQYETMFTEIMNLQREVFELMFRKGWYKLEKAESMKIDQKAQMLGQELSNLNG